MPEADLKHGIGTIPARAGSTSAPPATLPMHWDHPRASGEHDEATADMEEARGPSPRERGAPLRRLGRHGPRRTIPARAGSTTTEAIGANADGDHPRASGEHDGRRATMRGRVGPSPRERGAQTRTIRTSTPSRTIPARAGSTTPRPAFPRWGRDHPRASGEHVRLGQGQQRRSGPSPRERGALGAGQERYTVGRTIPARAGSTPTATRKTSPSRDHPRASGEHPAEGARRPRLAGPSPRERGARPVRRSSPPRARTIPARAGSTRSSEWTTPSSRDHPRASGEHPHLRGGLPLEDRTIPARAGSTAPLPPRVEGQGDHPRASGEHSSCWSARWRVAGPSPRERGARFCLRRTARRLRTIPARAGSTTRGR